MCCHVSTGATAIAAAASACGPNFHPFSLLLLFFSCVCVLRIQILPCVLFRTHDPRVTKGRLSQNDREIAAITLNQLTVIGNSGTKHEEASRVSHSLLLFSHNQMLMQEPAGFLRAKLMTSTVSILSMYMYLQFSLH